MAKSLRHTLPPPTPSFFKFQLVFFLFQQILSIKDYNCTLLRSIEQNTMIARQLLYNTVLASATHQHKSATGIHIMFIV